MDFKTKILPSGTLANAKERLFNTVYRSVVMRITNNETGEAEFVTLYRWTEEKK